MGIAMTREEQRAFREWKQTVRRQLKAVGKKRGWKTIDGTQYRQQGGMLYVLLTAPDMSERGPMLSMSLCCKPLALDEMFWEVHQMAAEAAAQPFSFHVWGSFTAPTLTLSRGKAVFLPHETMEERLENLFLTVERNIEEMAVTDLTAFHRELKCGPQTQHTVLDIILCLLCEGAYGEARREINAALARGEDGGVLRLNGGSILEEARDWCARRLAEETV